MLLRQVRFENFGVYSGEQTVDLALMPDTLYEHPIILLHGKNGVGKTSFVEAIRIALHGSLALGDRVSQQAYQEHLKRRIHRPANPNATRPTAASVSVAFDLVREGNTHQYEATRRWNLSGGSLVEQVHIWEDGQKPLNIASESYDHFLRDLVPPTSSDLFFFDGERIDSFAEDDRADAALADAIQRLFGLHLVQQLETDLNVYIARAAEQIGDQELQALQEEKEGLETQVADCKLEYTDLEQQVRDVYAAITRHEQELADKGGIYAKEYPKLQKNKAKLQQEVDLAKRRMQDAAFGLLPVAAAPKLAEKLMQRLDLEAKYHQQQLLSELLNIRKTQLLERLAEAAAPSNSSALFTDVQQQKLNALIDEVFSTENQLQISPKEVFIQISERERTAMSGQIKEALGGVTLSFHEAASTLTQLEMELELTERELRMAPSDIILQPIFHTIQVLDKQEVRLREDQKRVTERLAAASFKLEQTNTKIRRTNEKLTESKRVDLAIRAQRAIRTYAQKLRAKKLEAFQLYLVERFNWLCRKGAFLDSAHVDPETFAITVRRNGEYFKRSMLSAGEKQLFALSILWALREVAGAPMPVIIDTPLSRLDSDHRVAMLQKFLPEISHQVVLLATDTEVDEGNLEKLIPSISHGYQLTFSIETGSTKIEAMSLETPSSFTPYLEATP